MIAAIIPVLFLEWRPIVKQSVEAAAIPPVTRSGSDLACARVPCSLKKFMTDVGDVAATSSNGGSWIVKVSFGV